MRNVAFSPEYAKRYESQSKILFRDENRRSKEEGCFSNGYFLLCESYEGELDGEHRFAARYSLFTPNHDLVLSYDCLDSEHALSEMISHNDGNAYYVFRRDRFGFSVFNLNTLREHRYYSDEAFTKDSDFIWCGAEYYADRNTIFVVGHMPHAPFEVYEFDFSDPMTCVAFVPEDALILTLPTVDFADEMEDFRDEYINWGEENIYGSALLASFEDIAELWGGVLAAAKEHGIKELHLDLFPSINGLQISLMATGTQSRTVAGKIPTASSKDLICLSGNVGAAYMGQHVLEREKGAFLAAGEENAKQPDLSKYKYLLSQYLCPEIPSNVIDRFTKGGFYPTAGVFDCRGLAEAVNSLCEKTGFGAKLYLDRLPIASETFEMAAEVNIDAVTAAINGGDDYRLIYTIPLSRYEEFKREIQTFDVIGHLAHSDVGSVLVTPDGAELPLKEI